MIATLITTKLIPFLLAGAGFGLVVTVHEFGHFIFAKLFNIGVPVFSIGFGPSLIKKKIGATEFRLSLIPLGGYCAIQGMSDPEAGLVETDESSHDPKQSFEDKALWQKVCVLLGGIAFNLAFAYIVLTGIHWGTHQKTTASLAISFVAKESAAEKSGITKESKLTGYNAITFSTDARLLEEQLATFLAAIKAQPHKHMSLAITTPDKTSSDVDVTLAATDSGTGSLGIGLETILTPIEGQYEYCSLSDAIKKGVARTHHYITSTVTSLVGIFKQRELTGLGGPLAIFSQMYKGAQSGLIALFSFLSMLSISLAVINLIPLGALDGGQLLFILIEGITRRKLNETIKLGIIIASWLLFLGLTIVLSYHDIVRMIQ